MERISLSNISNKPISLPLHLGMTEKSLFTEVIMFENSHIRIRTLIFHLGRGRMNALPLSYTASSYTVARKVSYEKVFSPKLGESYRPESNRLFQDHDSCVVFRSTYLQTPQGGFEPPIPLWYCGLRLGESSFNYLHVISKTSLNYVRLQSTTIF